MKSNPIPTAIRTANLNGLEIPQDDKLVSDLLGMFGWHRSIEWEDVPCAKCGETHRRRVDPEAQHPFVCVHCAKQE